MLQFTVNTVIIAFYKLSSDLATRKAKTEILPVEIGGYFATTEGQDVVRQDSLCDILHSSGQLGMEEINYN